MPTCSCGNKADFLIIPNEEVHSYLRESNKEPICKSCLEKTIGAKRAIDVYDLNGKYLHTACTSH